MINPPLERENWPLSSILHSKEKRKKKRCKIIQTKNKINTYIQNSSLNSEEKYLIFYLLVSVNFITHYNTWCWSKLSGNRTCNGKMYCCFVKCKATLNANGKFTDLATDDCLSARLFGKWYITTFYMQYNQSKQSHVAY